MAKFSVVLQRNHFAHFTVEADSEEEVDSLVLAKYTAGMIDWIEEKDTNPLNL